MIEKTKIDRDIGLLCKEIEDCKKNFISNDQILNTVKSFQIISENMRVRFYYFN
jgi:hypothetical protein